MWIIDFYISILIPPYKKNLLLKEILKKINSAGIFPVVGVEIEFYLKKTNIIVDIENKGIKLNKERGINQFEFNIGPTKNINNLLNDIKNNISLIKKIDENAVFVPKPYKNDFGNAMQFNISLFNKQSQNILNKHNTIKICESICKNMLSTFLVFANSPNALERFDPKFMAPTNVCYGHNNRTAAVRVLPSRIEHRLANPLTDPELALFIIMKSIYLSLSDCNFDLNSFNDENLCDNKYLVYGNAFDEQYNLDKFPSSILKALKLFEKDFFN